MILTVSVLREPMPVQSPSVLLPCMVKAGLQHVRKLMLKRNGTRSHSSLYDLLAQSVRAKARKQEYSAPCGGNKLETMATKECRLGSRPRRPVPAHFLGITATSGELLSKQGQSDLKANAAGMREVRCLIPKSVWRSS